MSGTTYRPCPFCGSADVAMEYDASRMKCWVGCGNCGCRTADRLDFCEGADIDAAKEWNTRKQPK